jgi:hypothetical protein
MGTLQDQTRVVDRAQGAVLLNLTNAIEAEGKALQAGIDNVFGAPNSTAASAATPVSGSAVQDKSTLNMQVIVVGSLIGLIALLLLR